MNEQKFYPILKPVKHYDLVMQRVWCPATQRMVQVKGLLEKTFCRLDVLTVQHCVFERECTKRQHEYCLVGKELQGKWSE